MSRIVSAAGKLGIAVRGLYGEGSEAQGAIYQISNCVTLGFSELEIIEQLENTVRNIIRDERKLRERMAQTPAVFADRVCRAGAVLKSARILSGGEEMSLLSDLRLGLGTDYGEVEPAVLNKLLWEVQPANISLGKKQLPTPSERDVIRAELVRKTLGSN
jgi:protein arginine kinase